MGTDVTEAERCGVADQLPEYSSPARQRSDLPSGFLVDADGKEALELAARGVEQAERGVLGAGERPSGLSHALQNHLDVEVGQDSSGHVQDLPNGGMGKASWFLA